MEKVRSGAKIDAHAEYVAWHHISMWAKSHKHKDVARTAKFLFKKHDKDKRFACFFAFLGGGSIVYCIFSSPTLFSEPPNTGAGHPCQFSPYFSRFLCSGSLDLKEMFKMMQYLCETSKVTCPPEARLEEIFHDVDINHDGEISMGEWGKFLAVAIDKLALEVSVGTLCHKGFASWRVTITC